MQIIVCKLVVLLFGQNSKAPKPKQCLSATGTNKMLQHAGRIMKLTAVLLLGVCMQVYAAGYGQRITLSERDVPIEKVLKKIQQQTTYKFLYTSQLLQRVPKVTVVVKDATVEDVLDLVLKGQMLDYEVSESTVVIRPRSAAPVKETTQANMPDPIEIRGVITDENGAPASGVNVMVKGTSKGTTTNLRGEFVLRDVSESAVLLITSVGYDRQEILVKGKNVINTQLRVAVGNLDELQVIAYGSTNKQLNTGNVSTVKAKDLARQPVNNPLLALQGRVPGMIITQTNGVPGSGAKVQIRGRNSIRNGNEPLYVIDGVPYISELLPGVGTILQQSSGTNGNAVGNPLSFINTSDIESIDVLKDADATAIYGSRAANGAVLITTKKGKAGNTTVSVNMYTGWGKVTRTLDLLNTDQYLNMRHEAKSNDGSTIATNEYDINGFWDTTRYTDWQKALIGGTSHYNNAQATISGGNTAVQYLIGGGYSRETSVFPGDFSDQKASFHFNINSISKNNKFRTFLTGNYVSDINQLLREDLTALAITLPPNAPTIYNSDGSYNWAFNNNGFGTWTNPLAAHLSRKFRNNTNNLISNLVLSYQILPEVEVKTNLGYTTLQTTEVRIIPIISIDPSIVPFIPNPRQSDFVNNNIKTWIIEPQVSYSKMFGKGRFNVLIGTTIQQNINNGQVLNGQGFNTDVVLEDIKSAPTISVVSTVNSIYKYNALFGRVSYNWKDKYLVNLTARRDGSSRFGPDSRFHNFGAIGLGWIFSEETLFDKISFLSFGKIRASYGTSGSDQVGDYRYLNLFSSQSTGIPYQGANGLTVNNLYNPALEWEETKKFEVGLELGFLKNKLLLSSSYYLNRSSNQLTGYKLPSVTGFVSIDANQDAVVQNSGLEFSLNSINVMAKDFQWKSFLNVTIFRNKLISVGSEIIGIDPKLVGHPLGSFLVYHYLGVDPLTGKSQVLNNQGEATFNPNILTDRNTVISLTPKFYGGFQNSFAYKRFEIDFLFQFVKQTGKNYLNGSYPGQKNTNQPSYVLSRWQKPGDNTNIQKFTQDFGIFDQWLNADNSDFTYSDASFIRLKNLSVSWELPEIAVQKLKIRNSRLFIQGQNLITITKFKGLDPENQSTTSLPPLRVLTVGVQITLQ